MTKTEFTRDAERDLINIFLYGIKHFGPVQAARYAKTLNVKIEMAAEHPDCGVDYGFVVECVRRYESVSHAIYYRPTKSGILVLRVLHGWMGPARHLE